MTDLLHAVLLVAAGGFVGGLVRWGCGRLITAHDGRVGTFVSNILASFILGMTVVMPYPWALAVGVGLAGAMSTMSTFARELADLLRQHRWGEFGAYLLLSLAVGVIAAWRGAVWGQRVVAYWV